MPNKHKAAPVMLVAFLAGVAVTTNQFKVPPALPTLGPALDLDMVAGGWLISVSSVTAIRVVSSVGMLLGAPLVGTVVASGQWTHGSSLLLAATLLGILAALLAWHSTGDS
jgi:hypothetical protein